MMILISIGGLGFIVWIDLLNYRKTKKNKCLYKNRLNHYDTFMDDGNLIVLVK